MLVLYGKYSFWGYLEANTYGTQLCLVLYLSLNTPLVLYYSCSTHLIHSYSILNSRPLLPLQDYMLHAKVFSNHIVWSFMLYYLIQCKMTQQGRFASTSEDETIVYLEVHPTTSEEELKSIDFSTEYRRYT